MIARKKLAAAPSVQYGATLQQDYIQYHTHIVEVIGYGNTGCGVFNGGIQN